MKMILRKDRMSGAYFLYLAESWTRFGYHSSTKLRSMKLAELVSDGILYSLLFYSDYYNTITKLCKFFFETDFQQLLIRDGTPVADF